jgi:sulfur-carrier protein
MRDRDYDWDYDYDYDYEQPPMIHIQLPFHLRTLAQVSGEVTLDLPSPVTVNTILAELEAKHPALAGTIRDHTTKKRRDFIRFFACEQDLSNDDPDTPLPDQIVSGQKPFLIVGAIAGG